jgi:hypothetical protein
MNCKRHKWEILKSSPVEKSGPTGHKSGRFGIWKILRCVHCHAQDGQWQSGVDGSSVTDVLTNKRRPNSK